MRARLADRAGAGHLLAQLLLARSWQDPVVVGLPRGGVVVAAPVAAALRTGCEAYVCSKLPAPGQPEFAIGAVAEDGAAVWSPDADVLLPGAGEREDLLALVRLEVNRRVATYRGGRALPDLAGRDVVCVDDGLATGLTAQAAVVGLRTHHPRSVVLAVPVGAPETVARVALVADEVVCPRRPERFRSVGQWYADFGQVTDAEVLAALGR